MRACPESVHLHYELGNLLGENGDHEGALERHRAALARDPQHLGAAESRGRALLHLERVEQAVDPCRTALRVHADNAPLHHLLGVALSRPGLYEAAASALGRAVAPEPAASRHRTALYWCGLVKLGRHAEGERVLRGVDAREAASPDVRTALANRNACPAWRR